MFIEIEELIINIQTFPLIQVASFVIPGLVTLLADGAVGHLGAALVEELARGQEATVPLVPE